MTILYCWRCKENVPAFNEEESQILQKLWEKGVEKLPYTNVFDFISQFSKDREAFKEYIQKYEDISGLPFQMKCLKAWHRIDEFGPMCKKCGKPLRTKKARMCAECGWESDYEIPKYYRKIREDLYNKYFGEPKFVYHEDIELYTAT